MAENIIDLEKTSQTPICEYSLIYVSDTDTDSSEIESEKETDSVTWMSDRKELLQMSHSILSPSYRLDDNRQYVSETLEESSDSASDLDSIFDNSESPSFLGDSECNKSSDEEVVLASPDEIKSTQDKIEKYFEVMEHKELELGRRLTNDEKDVLYRSFFNDQ
jgi:hypothetical protein